jgi:glycosyltransferase involved in cell wall biosynthesis
VINLHISLTPFRNESRVLKETESLMRRNIAKIVYITALFEAGLAEHEDLDERRSVWRVKLKTRSWSKKFFVQLVKYFEFCWRVNEFAVQRKVRLINVHTLSLLPLGIWLKFRLGGKLVYDAHELETEAEGIVGFRKTVSKIVERLGIKFVDLTVVVSSQIESWYRSKYGVENIVSVLNCPAQKLLAKNSLLGDEFNVQATTKIALYQGGLVAGRGVELLLDAFESMQNNRYALVFMGYGELEESIKQSMIRCKNIHLKSAVPPAAVLDYTASADFGISIIEDSCLSYRYCLPNKLFEYIMARVPVVVSDLPEMRRVVDDFSIGVVLRDWSVESLLRALRDLEEMNSIELSRSLNRAAEYFSWENQEIILAQAYKKHVLSCPVEDVCL